MIAEALAFGAAASATGALAALRPAHRRRLRPPVRPPGLRAARICAGLVAGVLGLVAAPLLPGRLALLLAVAGPALGFVLPDLWLARRRARQLAELRRDMPALLDLLAVAVEAGLSLPAALAEVGRRSHAPLARAWGGIAAQVAVGVGLTEALEAHRRETPIPEVDSFTGALARAVRHGAPLGDTLASQAREVRLARRRAIQEEAARAGPKMQLVVALLLVPSVMLLVAAALVTVLADSTQSVLQ